MRRGGHGAEVYAATGRATAVRYDVPDGPRPPPAGRHRGGRPGGHHGRRPLPCRAGSARRLASRCGTDRGRRGRKNQPLPGRRLSLAPDPPLDEPIDLGGLDRDRDQHVGCRDRSRRAQHDRRPSRRHPPATGHRRWRGGRRVGHGPDDRGAAGRRAPGRGDDQDPGALLRPPPGRCQRVALAVRPGRADRRHLPLAAVGQPACDVRAAQPWRPIRDADQPRRAGHDHDRPQARPRDDGRARVDQPQRAHVGLPGDRRPRFHRHRVHQLRDPAAGRG